MGFLAEFSGDAFLPTAAPPSLDPQAHPTPNLLNVFQYFPERTERDKQHVVDFEEVGGPNLVEQDSKGTCAACDCCPSLVTPTGTSLAGAKLVLFKAQLT